MSDRSGEIDCAIGSKGLWFAVIGIAIVGVLLSGCGGKGPTWYGSKMGRVSKQELAETLDVFDELVSQVMHETTQRMYELDPGLKRRRTEVIKSIRLAQAFQSVLAHEDPVIAFVETWGLTVRVVDYFQAGHGQALYGAHQDVVIGAAISS